MEDVIPVQKGKPLQNLVAYQLFVIYIFYNRRYSQYICQLEVEVENGVDIVVAWLDLPSFRWFFVNYLMAVRNVLMVDWV